MSAPALRRVDPHRRAAAALLSGALGLATALGGCGGKTTTLNPVPDCDGTHLLLFTSGRNLPAGQRDVFLYDLDAGGFRALLDFGGTGQDQHPAITSDGKVIAVERPLAGHGQDVLVYERCSGTFFSRPELVTTADETEPAFSGDTRELAFVRDTLGVKRLRLYDGSARRFLPLHLLDSLATTGFNSESPSLDQNANLIAFVTGVHPNRKIGIYSRAGDSLLTTLAGKIGSANDDFDPWITPNGQYLALASDRPGGRGLADIYLFNVQTGVQVPTDSLNSTADDVRPTLTPDAVIIVFQSLRTGSPAKGKWDLFNYNRNLNVINQAFQESSAEDDVEPYLAWP